MASRRPERVRSLTSISSSPSPRLGRPALRAQLGVLKVAKRPVTSGEEYGEHLLELDSVIGSPDYPTDEAWLREYGRRCFERGYDRAGVERLSAVMRASGDRRAELAKITVPTVVIHGLADRIVPPAAGRATAAAIPGARLVTYPGMSSLPPEPLFPAIIDEIVGVAGLGEHRKETGATA
jgi:pimeloyl-ACP methyl ester carboxylesterase